MREPDELDQWVSRVLADVTPVDDDGALGRAVELALLNADHARLERFRQRVLRRVLCVHFKQDPHRVAHLLRQLCAHEGDPRPGDGDDDAVDEDGLRIETMGPNRAPLPELAHRAAQVLDQPAHWAALGRERPRFPSAWFARRIYWRTHDRLRGNAAPRPEPTRPVREQHRLAGMLDLLAEADPELDGPDARALARGAYGRVLQHIADHLGEHGRGSDAALFLLRKLFPWHAWGHPGSGRGVLGDVLQASLDALWADDRGWTATSGALADLLGCPAFADRTAGLDASSDHHRRHDDFPGWPEATLWANLAVPASTAERTRTENTLQRRIGRLNQEIEPFVRGRCDTLARQLAAGGDHADLG